MAVWKYKHKEQKYANGGLFWLEYKQVKEPGYKVKRWQIEFRNNIFDIK